MVTPVSSFGRSGLSDWVIQRVSAVILLVYILVLAGFIFSTDEMTFIIWQGFFAQLWVKLFTLLALIALCAHAWIGLWTVATDYLIPRSIGKSATVIRFLFLLLVQLALFVYLIWGIEILWSVGQ